MDSLMNPMTKVGVGSIIPPMVNMIRIVMSTGLTLHSCNNFPILSNGPLVIIFGNHSNDVTVSVVILRFGSGNRNTYAALIRFVLHLCQIKALAPAKMRPPVFEPFVQLICHFFVYRTRFASRIFHRDGFPRVEPDKSFSSPPNSGKIGSSQIAIVIGVDVAVGHAVRSVAETAFYSEP